MSWIKSFFLAFLAQGHKDLEFIQACTGWKAQILPGQVACRLPHLTHRSRKSFTLQLTPMGNSFPLIHLTCMSAVHGKKLDNPTKMCEHGNKYKTKWKQAFTCGGKCFKRQKWNKSNIDPNWKQSEIWCKKVVNHNFGLSHSCF